VAKTTTTKITGTTNSEDIQFGGVPDGYTGSEYHIKQAGVQTTDATVTTIASVSVAEDQALVVDGIIVGVQDDHSEAVGGRFMAVFRRATAGNVTLVGSVDSSVQEDSGGAPTFTLDADTSSQTARIRITGVAATNINWVVTYRYHKVLTNS